MKIAFLSAGKYRDGRNLFVVSPEDVKSEKVFAVTEDRAVELVEAKRAVEFKKEPAPEPPPKEITLDDIKKMSVPELKAYATEKDIDLGEATKKDDIFAEIEKTFKTTED